MWIYSLLYHFKTTGQNIREHRTTVILSMAAVGFTLLLFASYLLLLTNLQSLAERLGKRLQIVVYLEKGLSDNELLRLKEAVMARQAEACTTEGNGMLRKLLDGRCPRSPHAHRVIDTMVWGCENRRGVGRCAEPVDARC